jgi:hypothetical protein
MRAAIARQLGTVSATEGDAWATGTPKRTRSTRRPGREEVAKVGRIRACPTTFRNALAEPHFGARGRARLALALPLRYHILAHAEGAHAALRAF